MDFLIFTADPHHSSLYFDDFFQNYKKDKVYKENYFCEINNKKIKNLSTQLKKEINAEFSNIILSEELEEVLKYEKIKLSNYLYNECFSKKNYDESFLKLLILISNKYYDTHEILILCRYLFEKFKSELFIKILIYNHLLKSIYCSWGHLNELFKNPCYKKYYQNYPIIKNLFKKDEKRFFRNYGFQTHLDAEDVVSPLLSVLAYCKFFDDNQRVFYSEGSDFGEDEKKLKIIRQELKEKYIGKEKWIKQYTLYKNTKNIFKDKSIKVYREYSPRFLGLQRLDVYFEYDNQKVAFEYQGEQHYKPIDFFGGNPAYQKRKELDKKKKTKCKKNSVKLIEFKYTESISISSIIQKLKKININLKGDCYV